MVGEVSAIGQNDSTRLWVADGAGLGGRSAEKARPIGMLWTVVGPVVLCLLVTVSCHKQGPAPEQREASTGSPGGAALQEEAGGYSRPDISGCTHVEIQFESSALRYLGYGPRRDRDLLSSDEMEYLSSLKSVVWDDPEGIRILKERVRSASYHGALMPSIGVRGVGIACYDRDEHLTSFVAKAGYLDFGEHVFKNDYGIWAGGKPLIPELRPYHLRLDCAKRLLGAHVRWRLCLRDTNTSPPPAQWCDALGLRSLERPGAGEGPCHYAMNPNCDPNSAPDMVLLFETKAGWNQHGGLELFTFGNHEPKGGCVLLVDGTVKFIRTEEELHALRWR